jgi:hypothetical protein
VVDMFEGMKLLRVLRTDQCGDRSRLQIMTAFFSHCCW